MRGVKQYRIKKINNASTYWIQLQGLNNKQIEVHNKIVQGLKFSYCTHGTLKCIKNNTLKKKIKFTNANERLVIDEFRKKNICPIHVKKKKKTLVFLIDKSFWNHFLFQQYLFSLLYHFLYKLTVIIIVYTYHSQQLLLINHN